MPQAMAHVLEQRIAATAHRSINKVLTIERFHNRFVAAAHLQQILIWHLDGKTEALTHG